MPGSSHGAEGPSAMLRAGPGSAQGLPVELTSFVGRRGELDEVWRLLAGSRLVTLTGVGGVGKTRLAVRAAARLRRAFSGRVWFVDLTVMRVPKLTPEVSDPEVLASVVMTALGLRESGGGTPTQQLVAHLKERRTLLVLDNCEHLIPACAVLAAALLRSCAALKILATSREPLLVEGEALFPVPSLRAPGPGEQLRVTAGDEYESVALFVARARAVPDFALTERNVHAVGELCRRLDGLPLAIELAAARVRALAPEQILDRLNDRFALLTQGRRTDPDRQQTLRACVDWSFDLCAERERVLWARLSVFAGGFELDAVERVCADDALPRADVLELVTGLAEKSILIRQDVGGGPDRHARYRLPETIRDYGQDKLSEAGEDAVLRRRHRAWYQELAAHARAEWTGDRQASGLARLRGEHANLRAVVEFCLTEPGEADVVLGLAASLPWSYWRAPGVLGEGRRWLNLALSRATAATRVRTRALLMNSQLAFWQGDAAAAMRLLDEGEELARRLGAGAELAHACHLRGASAMFAGDLPMAVETLDRARVILADAPHPDPDLPPDLHPHVLFALAMAAGLAGDLETASAARDEALVAIEARGDGFHRIQALSAGGLIAWLQGDLSQAHAQQVQCLGLRRAWESDDLYSTAQCLEMLAWTTADQHHYQRAAVLLGSAESLWADLGTSVTAFGHYLGHHRACERRIRAALGDAEFTDAFREGRAMTYQEALAHALDEPGQPGRTPQRDAWAPLTRRERQVADLLARGMSNREIAAALVISRRTAEAHVQRILIKLGFTNRAQVAAWAVARLRAAADGLGPERATGAGRRKRTPT
jgi:predicted ATPase/DNA-binding NarL/FixJ family response regulator